MKFFKIFILFWVFSCNETPKDQKLDAQNKIEQTVHYAKGFTIRGEGDIKILTIENPWPNSEQSYKYALINRERAASITLDRDAYDGIILTPVKSIVVTSTTHLPALQALGVESTLTGFPGTDYISSPIFRKRVDNGTLRELGKNEDLNTEVLLELKPEVVVSFGVDGSSKTLELIKNSNISVIYNGDWVEGSPLAKAEWVKFFGYLFEKVEEADSIFTHIETSYLNAKKLALDSKDRPTVLSGALHRDVWYLPGGNSPEAQFFKDANVNYLWQDSKTKGSLSLSFEAVLDRANNADLWFSPSYYSSLDELKDSNPHYGEFDAFKNKNVFSFVNTKGKTGGVLYFEEGIARPDLVLKDIIKISHPKLLPDYTTYFFHRLKK